ncbi:MAG: gamma-glutamyltransferase [Acetobacteraceae bacterium]|nr:gamma-glutamyltransferase [Acetobacteraceae bacterium]
MRRLGLALLLLLSAPALWASQPPVESPTFMVVSAQSLASEAGAGILRTGGNAIDAAVAVGYALAVVDPCCGNLGGGGFMTAVLADGRKLALNFRETAPAAATPNMYLDAEGELIPGASLYGWRAVAVPGTVLGLDTALAKYGTLSRETVMAPAIRLARDGFTLTRFDSDIIARGAPWLRRDPNAARIFLRDDGSALQAGDRLVQPELAKTLADIAAQGPDAFYQGRIPQAVQAAAQSAGGSLTAADFAAYSVSEAEPLECTYRGYTFLSMPPPSSGGVTMCEILSILEGYDMHALGFHSAASVHLTAEAMRFAYRDRNTELGDPAFVANPIGRLLSKDYAASIRAQIGERATPSSELPAVGAQEKHETTHYSVIDGAGNAVAVTYTINGNFGAGVIADGTGFLLNDEMDDFAAKPGVPNLFGLVQGAPNAIAPGKRPLSSMAPTVVMHDGKVRMVLGSPGGARIITITLEVAINIIDYGMSPQEAVDAPRLHHQWLPDELFAEPLALTPDTADRLRAMGYRITQQFPWGASELIVTGPPLIGASDSRRPAGAAVGE